MAKYITLDGLGTFLSKLKDGSYKASTSEFGAFKAAGVRSSAITSTTGGTGSTRYYGVEIDSNGKAFVNVPWSDTNSKVTSVDNHYAPTENTGSALSAAGGTLTDIANSSSGVQVVTGLKRDAKGHVVGVNSVALKSTNTTYSAATTGATGLMSAADKTKLNGIATGANNYTHPTEGANTGNFGPSANATPAHGGTFTVPYVTVNNKGHVTAISNKTITLPADNNTDTKVTQTVTTSDASYPLLLAPNGQTATTTTTSYFNSGVTLNPNTNVLRGAKVYEALQLWGGTNIKGGLSPLDVAMDGQWSANRLSFMPASDIKIEYSTDSGTTWTDYEASDNQKQSLVTTGLSHSIKPGKKDTRQLATKDRVRVTITASAGKTYFSLKKIYIYMSQNGANGCKVLVEKANCTTGTTTFATVGTYDISGWSEWNSIPYAVSFGGGNTQTGNIRTIRLTYYFETYATGYGEATSTSGVTSTIQKINMIGETSWANSGGSLASTGHLYYWDSYKNATFPANVTATTFVGSLSGTATNATNVNIATSSTNSSYPLLFTSNVTAGNKRIYTDTANNLSYNPSTNELSTNGDIRFSASNSNRYITFDSNDSLKNSWRIGYLGSGSGDGNYLTFESSQSTGTFVNALQISNVNLTSTFSGDVLPATNNAKNLGSSSLKWANAYATTFHGALDGNATTATKLGTTTIGSASKPIYLSSGTPTACTSIDNSFISKTGGTSTLAWNSEVTLATIAGQAIKAKLPANPNTDTKVTSVDNHYAPAENANSALSANASGATAAWSIDVVKGVTIKRDAKGHVTGVSVTSGKLPANPNTDTKVTQTVTTSNANYPLLLAPSNQTATTTTTSYFDSGVTLNPSTNTIGANISGNAATATKLGTTTIGSESKPIYLSSGTPTACTTIHNDLILKTGGTSTLAWNSEVTLATIAGQAIKAKLPANPNSNTAHKHAAGVGLTCDNTTGTTSGTVTYKAKLKSETASTLDSAAMGSHAGRQYAVGVDKSGYLSVNVPWTTTPTGSTTTYGVLKVKTGDLSDITSHADSIAASYYHNHDKKYAASGHTHSDASGTSKGFVKLVNSDLQHSAHVNGEAAGLGHTHGQYANQHVVASALTDLDYRIRNVNANAISTSSGITSNATDLVQGKAVQAYAAPKVHTSSTSGTYGAATTSLYGHVKLSNGDVSTVATANGLAAGMDHYHSKTRISTSSTNGYYPMLFVNATTSGDTAILIDSSTGTGSTSAGIRYNPSGNTCYCSGGFFEASDERLKNFGKDIDVDLDKLAQLPKKYFTWKHDKDGKVHIGTSAQELQKIYPELVDTLEDGTLIVSYDTLSVIALKGVDVLYEKYKTLEERLNKIEKMLG